MANVATPLLSVPVPMELPPSRKFTVPPGVPVPGDTGVTVAVKITDWPNTLGFGEAVKAVVVSALTSRDAVADWPAPPLVEVMELVVLTLLPVVSPVMFTENEQELPVRTVAPEREILLGAVVVSVPPQVVAVLPAIVKPEGSVSVNATPVNEVVFAEGLVMVNVSALLAFSAMVAGLKAMERAGGPTIVRFTVLLVAPAPPSFEVIELVVLGTSPAWFPVRSTLSVQDAWWVTLPPDSCINCPPTGAVAVPPQLLFTLAGLATTSIPSRPLAKTSEKATPVRSVAALGLLIVNVSVVIPFRGIDAGLKLLWMEGAWTSLKHMFTESREGVTVGSLVVRVA